MAVAVIFSSRTLNYSVAATGNCHYGFDCYLKLPLTKECNNPVKHALFMPISSAIDKLAITNFWMMKRVPAANWMSFNNILYIGDDAKHCIGIIEKFNERLIEIEQKYSGWFISGSYKYAAHDKLQRHIHYHFEGGIAIFKFKNEDEIPAIIRRECVTACRELAFEQLNYAS